jgi:hypothetical protein
MPLVRSGRFDCISRCAEIHEWSGFTTTNWWPASTPEDAALNENLGTVGEPPYVSLLAPGWPALCSLLDRSSVMKAASLRWRPDI